MAVSMRLLISVQPPDIVFNALEASICMRLEALKGSATSKKQKASNKGASFTRSALSIILADVDSAKAAEIRRRGSSDSKLACKEASQRELQTSLGLSLIGRADKFKEKWAVLWRHLQRHCFKFGVYFRSTLNFNRNCQASQQSRDLYFCFLLYYGE
jgi:hypothetical protein